MLKSHWNAEIPWWNIIDAVQYICDTLFIGRLLVIVILWNEISLNEHKFNSSKIIWILTLCCGDFALPSHLNRPNCDFPWAWWPLRQNTVQWFAITMKFAKLLKFIIEHILEMCSVAWLYSFILVYIKKIYKSNEKDKAWSDSKYSVNLTQKQTLTIVQSLVNSWRQYLLCQIIHSITKTINTERACLCIEFFFLFSRLVSANFVERTFYRCCF